MYLVMLGENPVRLHNELGREEFIFLFSHTKYYMNKIYDQDYIAR